MIAANQVRGREPTAPVRRRNLRKLVAQFCATYPGEYRGGEIEAPTFFMLCREMAATHAHLSYLMADGVQVGEHSRMHGGPLEELRRRAYDA